MPSFRRVSGFAHMERRLAGVSHFRLRSRPGPVYAFGKTPITGLLRLGQEHILSIRAGLDSLV